MRVLLITGFAKRDLGVCHILSEMLERFNMKTKITSEARATLIHYRLWKPHAIVIFRESSFKKFSSLYKKSLLFYLPGEGGEQYEFAEEREFVKNIEKLEKVCRLFLWGNKSLGHINRQLDDIEIENKNYVKSLLRKKITICGHPRMDIARMFSKKNNKNSKIKVGLVGSFSVINHSSKTSTFLKILNGDGYKNAEFQIKLALLYKKICTKLSDEKYEISIRPYISENLNEYNRIRFKNINIDKNYDFNTWVSKQDVILGPTSSTIPQLVISGKKYILVDFVDNYPEQSVYRISLSKIFHENMPNNIPKSFDELMLMLENYEQLETTTEELNKILYDVYNLNPDSVKNNEFISPLKKIAEIIRNELNNNVVCSKLYLSELILDLIDKYYIKFDRNSYNEIVYSKIKSELRNEFYPISNEVGN